MRVEFYEEEEEIVMDVEDFIRLCCAGKNKETEVFDQLLEEVAEVVYEKKLEIN